MAVDKTKDFHRFGDHDVPVVVHIGEVALVGATIQPAVVHNLDAVVILIELYRSVRRIIPVADGVHQKFSRSPVGIIDNLFFAQCADRYGASVCDSRLDECVKFCLNRPKSKSSMVALRHGAELNEVTLARP